MLVEQRLGWLGHLVRMSEERSPRRLLNARLTRGKKGVGRPKKNWRACVQADLMKYKLNYGEERAPGVLCAKTGLPGIRGSEQ